MRVYNTLRLLETTDETNKDADKEDSKTTDENTETKTETKTEINFADVADDAYYASAVKWAVGKNITQGTSETTFSPDLTCTRAQIFDIPLACGRFAQG
ncbi:MAG: S-layer homology domain-containing protein [Clostridiales bacterium]|nr:MAG: S-layer homology domain-containing protein [Clostridiales bacterium]